jgi:hypothetical protein
MPLGENPYLCRPPILNCATVLALQKALPAMYYFVDVPYCDGGDVRGALLGGTKPAIDQSTGEQRHGPQCIVPAKN